MSTWRKKAIEIAPELKHEFQDADLSLHLVFSSFLSLLKEAHLANYKERIRKIYDYAEWCFTQKDQQLWNAAGVSFYEHLGDDEITLSQLPKWSKKDIYKEVRELLKLRLSEKQLKLLDKEYASL